MQSFFIQLVDGVKDILFPDVCLLCADPLYGVHNYVCDKCLHHEVLVSDEWDETLHSHLPFSKPIVFQWSCWNFSRKNRIQKLMHELKYGGKAGVGIDMGVFAASYALKDPYFSIKEFKNPLLLPVPLHPRKERMRGYNQARAIAEGMALKLNCPIIDRKVVQRKRYTITQTGLSIDQRKKNMDSVFRVKKPGIIRNRDIVLVDDVFTTGATTQELASCLYKVGANNIGIMTLAMA